MGTPLYREPWVSEKWKIEGSLFVWNWNIRLHFRGFSAKHYHEMSGDLRRIAAYWSVARTKCIRIIFICNKAAMFCTFILLVKISHVYGLLLSLWKESMAYALVLEWHIGFLRISDQLLWEKNSNNRIASISLFIPKDWNCSDHSKELKTNVIVSFVLMGFSTFFFHTGKSWSPLAKCSTAVDEHDKRNHICVRYSEINFYPYMSGIFWENALTWKDKLWHTHITYSGYINWNQIVCIIFRLISIETKFGLVPN